MGFFVQVNFTADRLFNSLKHMYCKKNMFVLEVMEALGASDCETIMSTVPKDFFKYDKLFKDLYWPLTSKVKQNHIFGSKEDKAIQITKEGMSHECNWAEGTCTAVVDDVGMCWT